MAGSIQDRLHVACYCLRCKRCESWDSRVRDVLRRNSSSRLRVRRITRPQAEDSQSEPAVGHRGSHVQTYHRKLHGQFKEAHGKVRKVGDTKQFGSSWRTFSTEFGCVTWSCWRRCDEASYLQHADLPRSSGDSKWCCQEATLTCRAACGTVFNNTSLGDAHGESMAMATTTGDLLRLQFMIGICLANVVIGIAIIE